LKICAAHCKKKLLHKGWHAKLLRDFPDCGGDDYEMINPLNPSVTLSNMTFSKVEDFSRLHPYKKLFARYYSTRCHMLYLFFHPFRMQSRMNWFTGKERAHMSFPVHGGSVVTSLLFDEEKIITAADDSQIHIYDIETGQLKRRLIGHEGGVWCLQLCDESRLPVDRSMLSAEDLELLRIRGRNTLISGSTDRSLRVWDVARGQCVSVIAGHGSTVRCLVAISRPSAFRNSLSADSPLQG
jgi:WD40 repeat protein